MRSASLRGGAQPRRASRNLFKKTLSQTGSPLFQYNLLWKQQMRQSSLKLALDSWCSRLSTAACRIEGTEVFLPHSLDNQIRLLNWKAWCLQETVSPEFVLQTLLARYRKVRRRGQSLGVSVPTLTGAVSRTTVSDAAAAAYPNQENVASKKCYLQLQMAQMLKPARSASHSIDQSIQTYKQIMQSRNQRWLEAQKQFGQRPWRGNPWR